MAEPAVVTDATTAAPLTAAVVNQPTSIETARDFVVPKEMLDWAGAKGYKDFETVAKANPDYYKMATSYRETEKFLGGDKLPLPKDMNDDKAMRPIYERLGMPKEAKDYKLVVPEGQPTEFAENFRQTAHTVGLSAKQAEGLNNWWNDMATKLGEAQENQRNEAAATEKVALEKEWGGKFNDNKEVATRAALKVAGDLGIPRDKLLDGLEASLGLRDASRLLQYLGDMQKVKGDTFEGGEHAATRGGRMAMTPEQAQQTKEALLKDKTFYQKYHSNDQDARKRLNDLNAIISQGQQINA